MTIYTILLIQFTNDLIRMGFRKFHSIYAYNNCPLIHQLSSAAIPDIRPQWMSSGYAISY